MRVRLVWAGCRCAGRHGVHRSRPGETNPTWGACVGLLGSGRARAHSGQYKTTTSSVGLGSVPAGAGQGCRRGKPKVKYGEFDPGSG